MLIAETTEKELVRGGNKALQEVVKQYAIGQVRMSAQKKGWKVKSVKEENGKVKLRLIR